MNERKALERIDAGMGQRPALIVVDVVVGFTDPDCPLGAEADSVVAANIELMNAFHRAKLPIVLTTVIY
ncbi:MAG: isochorismatase, partial [Gammaproteobacteria bacterium]|nr:isochorismatase [Gammaproteobacteria bacterium]